MWIISVRLYVNRCQNSFTTKLLNYYQPLYSQSPIRRVTSRQTFASLDAYIMLDHV